MTPVDFDTFDESYRATYGRLVGQLFPVTGDLNEAEEVVQEAFVRALARWRRLRDFDAPEAWVRRVALNLALSGLRRARRRVVAQLRLGQAAPTMPLTDEALAVIEALRHLPVSHRQALLLHYALDLSVDQVAAHLRLPASTIRGRLARGRASLRRHLQASASIKEL